MSPLVLDVGMVEVLRDSGTIIGVNPVVRVCPCIGLVDALGLLEPPSERDGVKKGGGPARGLETGGEEAV